MIMKAMMSGTLETAVMRCSHQCSTPCPAAPRPFTRASGVGMETRVSALLSAMDPVSCSERDEGDGPDQDRQDDRADEGEAGHVDPLRGLHAVPEIPHQVAHAAQHVVHEHPGIAEDAATRASGPALPQPWGSLLVGDARRAWFGMVGSECPAPPQCAFRRT